MTIDNDFQLLCQKLDKIEDIDIMFEKEIGYFVAQYGKEGTFENFCQSKINDDSKLSFIAFFALNIYLRRMQRIQDLEGLLKGHQEFMKYKSFDFLKLLYQMNETKDGYFELIIEAKQLCTEMNYSVNVLHAFAELVANSYEVESVQRRREIENCYLSLANEYIDKAITDFPTYAKYYCTKARILAIFATAESHSEICEQYYHQALKSLSKAFRYEKNSEQFQRRIEEYEKYERMIKSQLHLFISQKQLEKNILENIENQIVENTTKNIEILGIFSAIVTFAIGTIHLIDDSFIKSSLLVIILMSSLACVYTVLGIILHKQINRYHIIVLLGSLIIILGSLLFGGVIL